MLPHGRKALLPKAPRLRLAGASLSERTELAPFQRVDDPAFGVPNQESPFRRRPLAKRHTLTVMSLGMAIPVTTSEC